MSFISFIFIIAVFVGLAIYWLFPNRIRWIIILIISLAFYWWAGGWEKLVFVIATSVIVFFTALRMEYIYTSQRFEVLSREEKKKRAREYLIMGIVAVLFLLLYAKIGKNMSKWIQDTISEKNSILRDLIIPIGISYYSFGVIGYLADVYWRKDTAENNFFKFLLYMTYFPQILQGPIPRHKRLAIQFVEDRTFDYKIFCFGLQRAIWGYFKKLVIADRFAIIVKTVFGNTEKYGGQYIIVAVLASAVQLYCDFSGCMDIALGISESFGIKLDENFSRPFFSRSAAEFWRRWHITLGAWFKDYVYMPMVINSKLIKISKKIKDRIGMRASKNFMTIVPLAIVWLLTGLWHGTGLDYILWGCYWGLIIIISTIFAPEIKKFDEKLKINTNSKGWHVFQMFRTFIIFCGGRLLTVPGDIMITLKTVKSLCTTWNPWIWVDQSLYGLGLDRPNFWVGIFALVFMVIMSILQERGVHIRETVSKWFLPIRWIVYIVAIFTVLILGKYGPGFDAASFVYMNF